MHIEIRLQKIQGLTQHVAEQVDHLHERFDKFDHILTHLNNSSAHTASNTLARQQMPVKPRIFHGRDNLVQEISHLICEEQTSRACILGPGGMGKTSLALAVVQSSVVQSKYAPSHRFWVPCIEAASTSLFLQLLYINLRIGLDTKNTLEDILSELNRSKAPRLILLDNFETPWNMLDGTRKEVSNILFQLSQLDHVALLVTMRGTEPPCEDIIWQSKNLHPVDKEASLSIFHEIYPKSKDDPDVDSLLDVLGFMPFAVTLMARLGRKSCSSAKDLLKDWSQDGTGMISRSNSPEENMNRSIGLSVDSALVKQNPDALLLLATLSLLPAGTCRKNLDWWAPNLKSTSSAIATLTDTALLLTNRESESAESTTLFVPPVVQSFMAATNRIADGVHQQVREACCQYVFDHAYRYHDAAFKQHSEALATEDTNIQSLLASNLRDQTASSDRLVEALLRFTWYRFDTRPSIEVAQCTLDSAKISGKCRYIAEALLALGGTYRRLSNFEPAERYLADAYQLFQKLTDDRSTPKMATECGSLLATTRMYLCQPPQYIVSLVRTIQSRFGTHGDFEKACILKELGHCLLYAGEYSEALESLRKARDIFKPMGHLSDAAESMLYMAETYHLSSQLKEALESIEGACDAIERVDNQYLYALIHLNYGLILVTLNRNEEALPKFEKVPHIFQTCWVPDRRGAGLGEFWIHLPEPGRLRRHACSI
jgi:tetratricopeptide (TPR) repeat protein